MSSSVFRIKRLHFGNWMKGSTMVFLSVPLALWLSAPAVGQNLSCRNSRPSCGTTQCYNRAPICGTSHGARPTPRWTSPRWDWNNSGFSSFGSPHWRGTSCGWSSSYNYTSRRARHRLQDKEELAEHRADERHREWEAKWERRHVYRAPAPVVEAVRIDWGEPKPLSQIADEILAAHQANLRSRATPPVPKGVRGMTPVGVKDCLFYYKDGQFYYPDPDGNAVEVQAPPGATVFTIPEESERVEINGKTYFVYDKTHFCRVVRMGQLVYEVVEPPNAVGTGI